MDDKAATPATGTAVKNATAETQMVARIAAKLGTGRRPEPSGEAAATREVVTPPETEDASPSVPAEAESELAEGEESPEPAEAESEAEPEEPSEEQGVTPTLKALAEALEVDEDLLRDQLQLNVKVNGKDETVTLAEALKGYQREADYTRRTMELGDQRRQFEAQVGQAASQLEAKHKEADTLLTYLADKLDFGWTKDRLEALRSEDPAQYMAVKDALDDNRRAYLAAKAAREKDFADRDAAQKEQFVTWRKEQQRLLLTKMPELADVAKQAKFESEVSKYLNGQGFTQEDVTQFMKTFDHRHALIIRDAMRYRASKADAETTKIKLKALPKKAKAGAKSDGKTTVLATARDKFRQSGSAKDLEQVLKARRVV